MGHAAAVPASWPALQLRRHLQNHRRHVVMAAAARRKRAYFFEKKIQTFVGGLAAALLPDFSQLAPAQILVQRVAHLVQTVGGKLHGVSWRKLHDVDFVRSVWKHARRKTALTQRAATVARNQQRKRNARVRKGELTRSWIEQRVDH
jgi:hypothetical protein